MDADSRVGPTLLEKTKRPRKRGETFKDALRRLFAKLSQSIGQLVPGTAIKDKPIKDKIAEMTSLTTYLKLIMFKQFMKGVA